MQNNMSKLVQFNLAHYSLGAKFGEIESKTAPKYY